VGIDAVMVKVSSVHGRVRPAHGVSGRARIRGIGPRDRDRPAAHSRPSRSVAVSAGPTDLGWFLFDGATSETPRPAPDTAVQCNTEDRLYQPFL
jgi:hypothetical protein